MLPFEEAMDLVEDVIWLSYEDRCSCIDLLKQVYQVPTTCTGCIHYKGDYCMLSDDNEDIAYNCVGCHKYAKE